MMRLLLRVCAVACLTSGSLALILPKVGLLRRFIQPDSV